MMFLVLSPYVVSVPVLEVQTLLASPRRRYLRVTRVAQGHAVGFIQTRTPLSERYNVMDFSSGCYKTGKATVRAKRVVTQIVVAKLPPRCVIAPLARRFPLVIIQPFRRLVHALVFVAIAVCVGCRSLAVLARAKNRLHGTPPLCY